MAELIGGSEYDNVQDTQPTSPSIGDTWLDTSTEPPVQKVYADVGSGKSWVQTESDSLISKNLDAKVSSAGAGKFQGRTLVDFTETFSETDVTVVSSGISSTNESLTLDEWRGIDDFESGDLVVEHPDWSDWNDFGTMSAQSGTVLSGSFSGELTTDEDYFTSTKIQSTSSYTADFRFTTRIADAPGNDGDKVRYKLIRPGDSGEVTTLEFESTGNILVNGVIVGSWSANTTYNIELQFDFDNQEYDLIINGSTVDSNLAFDFSANAYDTFRCTLDYNESSTSSSVFLDNLEQKTGAPSGNATVEWTDPGYVTEWDKVWADLVSDGETANIDVQKSPDGGSTWNNHDTGLTSFPVNISNIDNDKLVRLKVNLSRTDTSNNPQCDFLQRRWIR